MAEIFDIAGHYRISVDDELDWASVFIGNQKAIIQGFRQAEIARRHPHLLRGLEPLQLYLRSGSCRAMKKRLTSVGTTSWR